MLQLQSFELSAADFPSSIVINSPASGLAASVCLIFSQTSFLPTGQAHPNRRATPQLSIHQEPVRSSENTTDLIPNSYALGMPSIILFFLLSTKNYVFDLKYAIIGPMHITNGHLSKSGRLCCASKPAFHMLVIIHLTYHSVVRFVDLI